MITIDPRGMTAKSWTDQMALQLWDFGPVPSLQSDDWRAWGAALLALASISGIVLPDPYMFADWQPWAERVNDVFTSWSG